MPLNATPVTTSAEALDEKIKAADGKLHVNCGFWGGLVPENADNLEPLLGSGVFGIKAFLVDSGLDDFPNVTETDLRKAMHAIAESKMPLLVHAELASNSDGAAIEDYSSFLASRPKLWEDDAIDMMIQLCAEYHCRTHIVHLSSSNSLEPIKAAKNKGLPITVETCPHYLMFNAESIPGDNTLYKCTPPIREKDNNDLLWKALSEGGFDFITSDHSPAPPNLKHLDDGNFEAAWGGIAGLQFLLPAFWTGASSRNMDLTDIARLLCQAPAEFIGLDSKGKIAAGYDADIVIWDPDKIVDTSLKCIQHKHKATPYSDLPMHGSVLQTYVNGQLVYGDGEFLSLAQGKALLKNQK
jgi:allantoinase